jgi:hypothetical protein
MALALAIQRIETRGEKTAVAFTRWGAHAIAIVADSALASVKMRLVSPRFRHRTRLQSPVIMNALGARADRRYGLSKR